LFLARISSEFGTEINSKPFVLSLPPIEMPLMDPFFIFHSDIYVVKEMDLLSSQIKKKNRENCYTKYFKSTNHFVYFCLAEKVDIILVLTPTNPCKALLINHINYRHIQFPLELRNYKSETIRKYLLSSRLFQDTHVVIQAPTEPVLNITPSLIQLEKNHSYVVSLQIGVLYIKPGQPNIQEIDRDPTPNFVRFCNNLGAEHFEEDQVFNDVFDKTDVKIRWYLCSSMDDEAIRRYIGNCHVIVIFNEHSNPFDSNLIFTLGKVNQCFFIVQEHPPKKEVLNQKVNYRVGILHRPMKDVPELPYNYLFDETNIRDFILTSAFNAEVSIQENSAISYMVTEPRRNTIVDIRSKFCDMRKYF